MKHPNTYVHCAIFYFFLQLFAAFAVDFNEVSKDCDRLNKYFNNINREETYGGPIFLRYLESWKEAGEKKIILSQIVPMYLKMFESLKITELNNSIDNIKEVLHYTNNNFLKQSDQKLKELNELKKIQMTDSKIRHKALKELFQVLQEIRCVKNPTSCAKSIKRKRNNQRKRRGSQS